MRYSKIIAAIQNSPKNIGDSKHNTRNISCTVYFLKNIDQLPCFLNLSENIGISETKSNDKTIDDVMIIQL